MLSLRSMHRARFIKPSEKSVRNLIDYHTLLGAECLPKFVSVVYKVPI